MASGEGARRPEKRSAAFPLGRNTAGGFAARPTSEGGSLKETSAAPLLGVGNDGENDIFIALDLKVEAPVPCYSALPDVERLAVFFRAQGRMPAIGQQETQLLAEGFAYVDRQARIVLVGVLGKAQLHFRRFFA